MFCKKLIKGLKKVEEMVFHTEVKKYQPKLEFFIKLLVWLSYEEIVRKKKQAE